MQNLFKNISLKIKYITRYINFHLTSRFKKLYPYQSKNKQNKETYHKAVDYFFNARYEKLLECLENSTSFIKESKMKFLKETIRLIKNNEEGVRNQTL
ncbi:MAG: hypothetical protein OHM56_04500 [Spiroplasma phoeniceum]|nr:MAG: hypothetical protein OHM57_03900 [Spiroplasma phoeniceum]UZQ33206.1 MAG: hypothetical protein OHM56_04500 [Spiroplasma phoeniceum]